jgi:hypothetical protein
MLALLGAVEVSVAICVPATHARSSMDDMGCRQPTAGGSCANLLRLLSAPANPAAL